MPTVAERHPPGHQTYVVNRGKYWFTATPCYGMHEPWWVVRTMPDHWPNEADPVPMQDSDEWIAVDAFNAIVRRAIAEDAILVYQKIADPGEEA